MSRKTIKVGTVIPVPVTKENIEASVPCDKEHCMLTLSGRDVLVSKFGDQNYKVKSTNHGMQFDINGYRVLTVFDHKTSNLIYSYDEEFKKTRNMQKAKALIKPFLAKLMVESCQKAPVYASMTPEKKAELREYNKAHPRKKQTGLRNAKKRRELSL